MLLTEAGLQLHQHEVHTHRQEPQQAPGPQVHEDARPLLPVQPQPPHNQAVYGIWPDSHRRRVIHFLEEGDPRETVQHHEGDQPVAWQPLADALSPYSPGKHLRILPLYLLR